MIKDASSIPLTANSGTLPNVSGALLNWFQILTFTTIVKTVVNFQLVETTTTQDYQAVIQPFTAQQLMIKPEGQRLWKWFTLHSFTDLILVPDDIATIQGVAYRVMGKWDWKEYGYIEYHLVEDYTS